MFKKNPARTEMTRKEFLKKTSAGLLALGMSNRAEANISGMNEKKKLNPVSGLRPLGGTGIETTPIGCGATRTMEPSVISHALDMGINFIDTGRSYFNGRNEEMVGEVIKGMRPKVVIQSKISLRLGEREQGPLTSETTAEILTQMQASLEASLKALQTDYIDIMLLHNQADTELLTHEPVREFFSKAKAKGDIRAFGFSSHGRHVELMKTNNRDRFYQVVMVPYNHKGSYIHANSGRYGEWDQEALEEEMKTAEQNRIGIVAMKSCSAGPFAFSEDENPTFTSALKWILEHSSVSTTAVAMANLEQVEDAVRSLS